MQLLDGNLCSEQIRQEITQKVDALKADGQRAPHLAAVLVGNDGASENYVAFKVKDCAQVGFESTTIRLPDTVSEEDLLAKVDLVTKMFRVEISRKATYPYSGWIPFFMRAPSSPRGNS